MNEYAILDWRGKVVREVTAATAHEALAEATKWLGSEARVAIIKTQLEKEDYARSSDSDSTPAPGTSTRASTSPLPGTPVPYTGAIPSANSRAGRARSTSSTG